MRVHLRGFASDQRGNVSIVLASSLPVMIGVSALAVDTGAMFLKKRNLQGMADAAALAAAADTSQSQSAAASAISVNPVTSATLQEVVVGNYIADTSLDANARFRPNQAPGNAVRVSIQGQERPLFSWPFNSRPTPITAQATAARINMASISIGSRLAAVNGGLPNAVLSELAGTELRLSALDCNALLSGNVEILTFIDALRTTLHLEAATFGEVLEAQATLPQIAQALAVATENQSAASVLRMIAGKLPGRSVKLAHIIDLGPLAADVRLDLSKPITVSALSALQASLGIGAGTREVATSVNLGIPGLLSSDILLEIGERPASSPWLAVNGENKITVRTAQTRLAIVTTLAEAPAGLGVVKVPIFVELGQSEARLSSVTCARGGNATVMLSVTPSVGQVAIADFDQDTLSDFRQPVALKPATILSVPLVNVTAFANIRAGGGTAQQVSFNSSDITNHTVKTVSTDDVGQEVATSLIQRTDLKVKILGLGLSVAPVSAAVGNVLTLAAPALDQIIGQVSDLSGARIGQADVQVNGVRCGTPVLVG